MGAFQPEPAGKFPVEQGKPDQKKPGAFQPV